MTEQTKLPFHHVMYILPFHEYNDRKTCKEMLQRLDEGWVIISENATRDAVFYILQKR